MKKIIFSILAIIMVVSLVACKKKSVEPIQEEITPSVQEETSVSPSHEEMYSSIVSNYQKALTEYDLEDLEIDEKLANQYPLLNINLLMHLARYANEGVSLTHSFYDIDNNGVDELLVGANNAIGAIYTYDKEEKTVCIIAMQSTMERGNLSIYSNGVILMEGAGGAALHYYEFGEIGEDGVSYQVKESIQEEYVEGSDTPIYTNAETGEKLEYQSLSEIMNQYINGAVRFIYGE